MTTFPLFDISDIDNNYVGEIKRTPQALTDYREEQKFIVSVQLDDIVSKLFSKERTEIWFLIKSLLNWVGNRSLTIPLQDKLRIEIWKQSALPHQEQRAFNELVSKLVSIR